MLLPMASGNGSPYASVDGPAPRITSLLIKPASAICNLDCEYCFYLDRATDPYEARRSRVMQPATLEKLVSGYLAYSYPVSSFAFQGGEPTLAGIDFFRRLVELQAHYGRAGQTVGNSIQTNGVLLNNAWCELFKRYNFLVGLSLDGPADVHDKFRYDKEGRGSWTRVMAGLKCLRRHKVDVNILCVISQANVRRGQEIYRYFRSLGLDHLQF